MPCGQSIHCRKRTAAASPPSCETGNALVEVRYSCSAQWRRRRAHPHTAAGGYDASTRGLACLRRGRGCRRNASLTHRRRTPSRSPESGRRVRFAGALPARSRAPSRPIHAGARARRSSSTSNSRCARWATRCVGRLSNVRDPEDVQWRRLLTGQRVGDSVFLAAAAGPGQPNMEFEGEITAIPPERTAQRTAPPRSQAGVDSCARRRGGASGVAADAGARPVAPGAVLARAGVIAHRRPAVHRFD